VYHFFKRRYRKAHQSREAALFLSGAAAGPEARSVKFGKPSGLEVVLERSQDSVTVRYRYGPLLNKLQKERRAAETLAEQKRRRARRKRVQQGWKRDDCVKWDCRDIHRATECMYTGNILIRKGSRYKVLVTESEADASERGADLWVDQEDLVDCR
jgi:hypothetical protein